jgi:hypothetical protein
MGNDFRAGSGGRDRSRAALVRDAALARVARTRGWVIAGAAALTAAFAGLVSAVAPGRTLTPKAASGAQTASAAAPTSSSGSAIPRMPPPANASDLGLQSPGQAPSAPDDGQSQSAQPQPQSQPDPSQAAPAPAPPPPPPVVSGGS